MQHARIATKLDQRVEQVALEGAEQLDLGLAARDDLAAKVEARGVEDIVQAAAPRLRITIRRDLRRLTEAIDRPADRFVPRGHADGMTEHTEINLHATPRWRRGPPGRARSRRLRFRCSQGPRATLLQ